MSGGRDVDVPGVDVRLRATRWRGSGPPILLLHGLASSRRFWDLVVPGLVGLPLVALDQRGHGDSERPERPYDGATVADDALTALDALGISRAVVVGHSWGAWTALRLAAQHSERVLAVIALDGGLVAPIHPDETRERARERLAPPQLALPPEDLMQRLAAGPLAPWWSDEVAACIAPLFAIGEDGLARARLPFAAHMAIVDDLLDTRSQDWLGDIACPAWLVGCGPTPAGDAAVGLDAALAAAAQLLARPRLQRWHGAVHDVPLQWPALVAGLVRAAAAEVSGPQKVGPARSGEGAGA